LFVVFHAAAYFIFDLCVLLYIILQKGVVRSLNWICIQMHLHFIKDLKRKKHFLNSKPALGHFPFPSQTDPAWPPLLSFVHGPAEARRTSRHHRLSRTPGANLHRQAAKQKYDLLGPKPDPQPKLLPVRAAD
jgi:hypothetical protein